jgi:hypothetical protein
MSKFLIAQMDKYEVVADIGKGKTLGLKLIYF